NASPVLSVRVLIRAPSNTPFGQRSSVVGRSSSAPRMPSPTLRKYWTTSSLVTPRAGKTTRSGLVTRTVRPATSSSTGGVVAAAMPTNLDRVVLGGEQGEHVPRPRPLRPPVAQLERARGGAHVEVARRPQPPEDRESRTGLEPGRHVQRRPDGRGDEHPGDQD